MRTVVIEADRGTKTILTIIAVCTVIQTLARLMEPSSAVAQIHNREAVDVYLRGIDLTGNRITAAPIPVEVSFSITGQPSPLRVEVQQAGSILSPRQPNE